MMRLGTPVIAVRWSVREVQSSCYSLTTCVCSSCRWRWSSWREVSSGRPLWEVAGPRCLPGDSPGQPESHHLWQPPLLQWVSEEGPHAVAEAELQGTRMDQPQLVPTLFKWSIFQSPLSSFVTKGEGRGRPRGLNSYLSEGTDSMGCCVAKRLILVNFNNSLRT